jgi:hypothetical protein
MPRIPRVVRRNPSTGPRFDLTLLRPMELLATLRAYLGLGRAARMAAIDTPEALGRFIETRASFIAQTSLYGYIRTRAGLRYPELFDDDAFLVGVNIAKWEIWLDCLADLSVYAGSRIAQEHPRELHNVATMMAETIDAILVRTGKPHDAGGDFLLHCDRIRDRIARTDWLAVADREAAFTESPASVIRWAPIADGLKELDEEIVLNSVRFRWKEVRRSFRQYAVPAAILGL